MPNTTSDLFKKWVNDYGDALYSWAFYKTSSKEIAEDLVQDTFLAAFDKLESFQNKSQPKTWLFSILNFKIIDYYRKNSKTIIVSEKQEKFVFESAEDLFNDDGHWAEKSEINEQHWLDNPEFNSVLTSCLDKLPYNWQFAIQAKYLLNKEGSEVCKELEITPANYWQIIHRSKLLLRKCIETNWIN